MAVIAQRVAAVRGAAQGSGFLLSPRLVLTTAHLLVEDGPLMDDDPWSEEGLPAPDDVAVDAHLLAEERVEAAVPGGTGWSRCAVVWVSRQLDAVLLLADKDLVEPATARRFGELRWAEPETLEPLEGCHLTGFPAASRDEQGRLDSTQVLAALLPGSGLRIGRPVLAIRQHQPKARRGTDSAWAGMSGAAAFYQDRLLGLAVRDRSPEVWESSQFELVPAAALLADRAFTDAIEEHLGERPRLERLSPEEIADTDFERRYAEAIRADYGRIRIFGLRSHAQGRAGWDLDTAYLSLEATGFHRPALGTTPITTGAGAQRVEQALRGRRRVLLRGQAGSGKTTLVQWLAVRAMAGTLGADLDELNHRVPLVLQLRKLYRKGNLRPRPDEFLALDDRLCADQQPGGWAHRLLAGGRALLLVDGLDEVPDADREEALEWLDQLLGHYPKLWTLITVRPSAVPAGWLDHLGFDELSLCAMSTEDRREFIERWHQAALKESLTPNQLPDEAELIRRQSAQDQADLLRTLENSATLSQLTDSPLLCAMICALNRESNGVLPVHRMEVYRDALSMMLVKRDESRRVQGTERMRLSETEQLAMLRRIAHWLVRNNQVEGGREDAVAQLERALRDLPGAAVQGDAEQAYRHLLNRSGLITETSTETFQFVHRTFQDYLAAMEFQEERDFGMLVGHAAEEQWGDVIRMTVGHCGRRDRADLLQRILARADAAPDDVRLDLLLLAASCLPYAQELSREVAGQVLDGLRPHLAGLLADEQRWERLVGIGEYLLPPLRELARDHGEEMSAVAAVRLPIVVARIGGRQALDLMEELATSEVGQLASGPPWLWQYFDDREYARRVLAKADRTRWQVNITSRAQLELLRGLMPVPLVQLRGFRGATPADFAFLAESAVLLGLDWFEELDDLSFLADWQHLQRLHLSGCRSLVDLEPLRGLPLTYLGIVDQPNRRPAGRSLDVLADLTSLSEVSLSAWELVDGTLPAELPRVERVLLNYVADGQPLDRLTEIFPRMSMINLFSAPSGCSVIDLRGLAALPELRVIVDGEGARLLGEEEFGPGRLTVVR